MSTKGINITDTTVNTVINETSEKIIPNEDYIDNSHNSDIEKNKEDILNSITDIDDKNRADAIRTLGRNFTAEYNGKLYTTLRICYEVANGYACDISWDTDTREVFFISKDGSRTVLPYIIYENRTFIEYDFFINCLRPYIN